MNLPEYLQSRRELVEQALDEMLPPEHNKPQILHQAMRYSVFAGGKRIRPILAMAAAELVGGDAQRVLPLAVSLECIHTYSLVHDDLPAMDDDDMRRGKPTAHKVFGEAVAILAGDALLTHAFGLLSSPEVVRRYPTSTLLAVISELARASGSSNLIAGQVMDISAEGKPFDRETVDAIVRKKTGALIVASLTCGGQMAGGTAEQIRVLRHYGEKLGRVFQIRDDLLDLEGDPVKLGKAVGKDQSRGKATYPRLIGAEKSRQMSVELINDAVAAVEPLEPGSEPLVLIAKYLAERVT